MFLATNKYLKCSNTCLRFNGYLVDHQREQLQHHENMATQLEAELTEHRRNAPEKGSKSRTIQQYCEKESYLHFEVTYNESSWFPQSWKSMGKNLVMEKSWKMGIKNKVVEIKNILKSHGISLRLTMNHAREVPK